MIRVENCSYNGQSHDESQNLTPCSLTPYSLENHYYREKTYETDALYEPKRIAKKKYVSQQNFHLQLITVRNLGASYGP